MKERPTHFMRWKITYRDHRKKTGPQYPSINLGCGRNGNHYLQCHILVWECEYGPKPDGHIIHHKDHNKDNFALENLELMTARDHLRWHAHIGRPKRFRPKRKTNGAQRNLL